MKHFLLTLLCAIQSIIFWVLFGISFFSENDQTILIVILVGLLIVCAFGSTRFRLLNKFNVYLYLLELVLSPVTIARQLVFFIIKYIDKPNFIVNENVSCLDENLTIKQKITQYLFCYYDINENKEIKK